MSTSTSKPTLYVFGPSVWAKVPELALVGLGYPADAVEKKSVNLVEAENLSPEFVKISKPATLPVLVADGKTYTSTIDVTHYLVQHAPHKHHGVLHKMADHLTHHDASHASKHQKLIDVVHEDSIDPNFPFVGARSKEELEAKKAAFPGLFIKNRFAKVTAFNEAADEELKAYYATKLPTLGFLNSIYTNASADQVEAFVQTSVAHMQRVDDFLRTTLPSYLPEHGFVEGEKMGEADFHLAAWLARIALIDGAAKPEEGKAAFEKELGEKLDEKVARYWDALVATEAFKTVYADGLH